MKLQILSNEGLVYAAMRYIINDIDNISLLGLSKSIESTEISNADIILLDIDSTIGVSPEKIDSLLAKYPTLKFILISEAIDKQKVIEYLNTGPKGFVTKKCSEHEIRNTLISVSLNQKFYCNKVLDILMEHKLHPQDKILSLGLLTERELQVVKMIAKGMSTYEIADSLNLSHHTINTHRKNILKKWQISSPVELVLKAIELGIID